MGLLKTRSFLLVCLTIYAEYCLSTKPENDSSNVKYASGAKRSVAGDVTPGLTDLEIIQSNLDNEAAKPETPTSISPETGCHYAMDLVLVLDSSHTITSDGWLEIKNAAKKLVSGLDISPQGTHVSIMVYSTDVENFYMFDRDAVKDKLSQLIEGLPFYGEWSRLDTALSAVQHHVFLPLSGARAGVPKVVVVFTDGITDGPVTEPDVHPDWLEIVGKGLDALRMENVILFAIAAGSPNYKQLDLIGGDRARVFNLTNIDRLPESLLRISEKVCPEVQKTPVQDAATASVSEEETTTTVTTTVHITLTVTDSEVTPSASSASSSIESIDESPAVTTTTSSMSITSTMETMPTSETTATVTPTTLASSSASTATDQVTPSLTTTITALATTTTALTATPPLTTATTTTVDVSSTIQTSSDTQTVSMVTPETLTATFAVTPTSILAPVGSPKKSRISKSDLQQKTQSAKRSWYTDYVPNFVREWMAMP